MCAIFGIVGHSEAAHLTYLGLHAMQHRGQEGAGISTYDGSEHHLLKKTGLVTDVFDAKSWVSLPGHASIGHTRYSTAGGCSEANIQPFLMRTRVGWLSVAHNGNIVNAPDIIRSLEKQGSIFQSTSDTEIILHLIAKFGNKSLPQVLKLIEGAYSLLIMNETKLIAVRDPFGFRPLVLGVMKDATVVASETCALDLIGADFIREIAPGEMVEIDLGTGSYKSHYPFAKVDQRRCIFEHIYFARPDSELFGATVYEVRKQLGRVLAEEHPADGDMVIPVPDSGVPAAIGYAERSGIPFDMGLVRSHHSGRSFLQPKQHIRDLAVRMKLNAIKSIRGKRLVVIDDSIVRGTTSKKIIKMLRSAGAKEIHLRISAPPITSPCVYGIDTPTKEELLGAKKSPQEIARIVGADTIGYLSIEGLHETAAKFSGAGWCMACFNGDYPT